MSRRRMALICVFLLIALGSGGYLLHFYLQRQSAAQIYADLQAAVSSEAAPSAAPVEVPIDFALLQDTNPFNAKKNAAELDRLLRKFFPEMGKFATKLKQYDQTIKGLERSKKNQAEKNAALEQELKEATTVKTSKKLEEAQLKADLYNLQRVMDAIPPEIVFRYSGKKLSHERSNELE